jgi:hypothetical protein
MSAIPTIPCQPSPPPSLSGCVGGWVNGRGWVEVGVRVGGWVGGRADGRAGGLVGEWAGGWVDGLAGGRVCLWVGGWSGVWVGGRAGGWIVGWWVGGALAVGCGVVRCGCAVSLKVHEGERAL